MTFPLALIGMAGGMASQAAGGAQNAAATKEGAQTQAAIEAMNRQFQKEVWDAEMGRRKPYYDAGLRNLPQLMAASQYRNDPTQSAAYRAQYGFGENALRGAGLGDSATLRYLSQGGGDAEREASYNRLLDLERIGLGASESAGSGAQNYANAVSNSLMTAGNAMGQGYAGAAAKREGAYQNALGQASSIPAYYAQLNYTQQNAGGGYRNGGGYYNGYRVNDPNAQFYD